MTRPDLIHRRRMADAARDPSFQENAMTARTYQKLLQNWLAAVAILFAGCASAAAANTPPASDKIETESDLREYVAFHTDQMVGRLDELRKNYQENPENFYRTMEQELSDFVDFRRIAARVMARYARQATPEQRDAFVEKFKRSLFEAYSQALSNTEGFRISVDSARFISDAKDRASVALTITSEAGQEYGVTYSLFENSEGRWMMENVVVEGVNIGLAFRDRFQQDMEKRRGDIQAVIANWSGEVEGLEEKAGVQGQGSDGDE